MSSKYKQRTCLAYDHDMTSNECSPVLSLELSKGNWKEHPERPERMRAIISKLKDDGLLDRCLHLKCRSATEEELALIHTKEHIEAMKSTESMSAQDLHRLSMQSNYTFFTGETYRTARLAAGNTLQVVDTVLSGHCLNGFACIRPPGHHSDRRTASGFCIFNNVAIAAEYAIQKYDLKRVLIVDWDVHHGDGTQKIFANDDRVVYISLHRYDHGTVFPKSKQGNYDTCKNIVNIPWNGGSDLGDPEYANAFFRVVLPVAYSFRPDLVLVSAGFDAAENDSGGYRISANMFGHMTHWLSSLADGKLVLVLEGGYNTESISEAASRCLSVLLGATPEPLDLNQESKESAKEDLKSVLTFQSKHWPILKL